MSKLTLTRQISDALLTTSLTRYNIRDGAAVDEFGGPLDPADRIETITRVPAPCCWIVRVGDQEFFLAHEDQIALSKALDIKPDIDPGPVIGDYTKIRVDTGRKRQIAYGPADFRQLSLTRLQASEVLK